MFGTTSTWIHEAPALEQGRRSDLRPGGDIHSPAAPGCLGVITDWLCKAEEPSSTAAWSAGRSAGTIQNAMPVFFASGPEARGPYGKPVSPPLKHGAPPAWLVPVVASVLTDLGSKEPPFDVTYAADEDTLGMVYAEYPDGTHAGFGIDPSASIAQIAVAVADGLQTAFIESASGWGEPRPPCPGHTHPMTAELVDGEAWWTCPTTRLAIARFGTLTT